MRTLECGGFRRAWQVRQVRVLVGGERPFVLELPRRRLTASNPHQLLVLMIGTSLLMTAIATLFLRNQVRPIRQLARAAEEYGKGRIIPYRPGGATEVRNSRKPAASTPRAASAGAFASRATVFTSQSRSTIRKGGGGISARSA